MKKGEKFHIVPSDGFLGIYEGEVKIIRIAKYDDVCEEYSDPEQLASDFPELKDGKWIVYKYTKPTCSDMYDAYCLDEETFEEHTSEKARKRWEKIK